MLQCHVFKEHFYVSAKFIYSLPVLALSETFFLFILKYNLELWLQNEKKIGSKYYVPVRTLYGFLYFVNQTIITEIWCIYDKEGL